MANSSDLVFHCGDPGIETYIYNLTSSYADKSNESSVVATSIIMLVLAAVFFNLNLFSRVSYVSGVLNPTVHLVLSTALSLFLPVMSYLFSEAKNVPMLGAGRNMRGTRPDLPLRARMILTWMLLVELLRKKVEAILVKSGVQQGGSSIIGHVTSVLWLGYLVFFNLKGAGRKAVFGILWVLCATKLVQRIFITELGKRSFAYGKNARLLSSYMAQMLRAKDKDDVLQPADNGSARLRACKYVVMGEEKMVQEAGPHGYKLDLDKITSKDNGVVTVGKIWQQLDKVEANRPQLKSALRLKSLSLSFALFKLLRRRFETLPAMTKEETDDCRDLIFKGLCKQAGVADPEVVLFHVINDEVNFLSEYYHSVLPVMFASPYFFLVNYFVFPVVVLGLCAMTVVLCANGNISFSFQSIQQDNYALSSGIITLTKCLWGNVFTSPQAFFSLIDISISYLLFIAFIYEEVWEFIIFVLSNWFSVSLLCNYTAKSSWRQSPTISGALRRISWVRNKLSDTSLIMCKQFSVLTFCWISMTLPAVPLPKLAKRSIMERFMAYGDDGRINPLSNGRSALLGQQWSPMSRFCESDSVAEVIATWHIATSLLEKRGSTSRPHGHKMKVATILSKYCAYLLAFHPELLPDDQEGTKRVYEGMKKDLKEALGCWGYYVLSQNGRCDKLMGNAESLKGKGDMTVVDKGVVLGTELVELMVKGGEEPVWELLAQLWVELIVYIGPSGSEEHNKAHEVMLVQGSELITLLWALTTHTGIARVPVDIISPVENIEEGVHLS
ncbi:unnamed protein product [Urochloa decumbens]|uniref:DUF4220 domain-containing protein n=1 Tax=Urochloa decumbens TaxID=240449 RepID=A0ABC9H0Y3_9POAL